MANFLGLEKLRRGLRIPYPEKQYFLREIENDFEFSFNYFVENGNSQMEAEKNAARLVELSDIDQKKIENCHSSSIYKKYWMFSEKHQQTIEYLIGMMPVLTVHLYLIKEVPMMDLIQQGGAAMYPILLVGALALILQFKIFFSWFIARNHSEKSLEANHALALSLGIGCFLIGVFGTLMGLYQSFHYVEVINEVNRFQKILALGISESIVSLIFGSGVLLLVFFNNLTITLFAKMQKIPVQSN